MSDLYWCPCIVIGSVRYYLPPWIAVQDSWGQNVEVVNPPYGDRALIAEIYDNQQTQITLQATGVASGSNKARTVLDWMAEVRAQLRGRTFSLYLFNDRGYEVCALSQNSQNIPLGKLTYISTDLDIISEAGMTTALPTLDFPGGYENDYPYAANVGRPDGTASTGDSGIAVIQASTQTQNGHFPGLLIDPTDAGEEHRFTVGGGAGSKWEIVSIQITSADAYDALGPTTLRVSPYPMGTVGAPVLSATITAGQQFSSVVTGNIPVNAGSPLYVWASDAGSHGTVQYAFQLKGVV